MNTIPTIATKRFILKGHQLSDFEESAAMWADPLVTRYTTGYALNREEAWSRMLRNWGHWAVMGYGYWVIREKSTGRFVGEVGFGNNQRQMEPACDNTPELSTALASWSHSKGFALEILPAVLAWGDQHLPSNQSITLVYPENTPSIRLALRFGYLEHAQAVYKGELNLLFKRDKPLSEAFAAKGAS